MLKTKAGQAKLTAQAGQHMQNKIKVTASKDQTLLTDMAKQDKSVKKHGQ